MLKHRPALLGCFRLVDDHHSTDQRSRRHQKKENQGLDFNQSPRQRIEMVGQAQALNQLLDVATQDVVDDLKGLR